MNFDLLVTFLLPVITGAVYFFMALKIKQTGKYRAILFGEIGFKKLEFAYILFGIYFITRPLQNFLGPHPMPMMINSARQFFLMAIIAPSILSAIFHWVPSPGGAPKTAKFASYVVGVLMGIIFVLVNSIAVKDHAIIYSNEFITAYDPLWFVGNAYVVQLIIIHLICQFVAPVGFLLLAAAYVRHRRHHYELSSVYDLMPRKLRYLEASLMIFAFSFIIAGGAVVFGKYYTFVWAIYFIGAIIAAIVELKSILMPPRSNPADLKN